MALNITKNTGEATEYNHFHIWHQLLALQSEQTRHNKCGYYFRRRMPAVWERSHVRQSVFPTHRLYINGRPSIFGGTFLFLLLLLSLTLFLSARDNENICDRLTSGKSPLAPRVLYCSFCVLNNCRHSHRQSPVFPIWFICDGPQQHPPPAAISSRVSHTWARL